MRIAQIFLIVLIGLFTLGNRGCQTTDTVVVPEGPVAAQLSAEKDKQIAGLTAQVKAEQEAREIGKALASKAASNIKGILKAREYLEPSLPSEAIQAEGELGLQRLPTADPAETVKALERVVLIVTGQRDEAEKRYREANAQIQLERAAKEAKDRELAARDVELKKRADALVQLEKDKKAEIEQHKKDFQDALDKKDKEFADYKKAEAEKERRWLINATRIAALGLIVAGAIALAAFKMIGVGSGLATAGVLVGLISIGVETLTAQPWWPILCGVVFVLVVAGAIYGIYRLWVKHQLGEKKTQAIQDMIDEATAKGDLKAVEELKAHLTYRMGDKSSYWGKQQAAEVVALGLVNPKGEEALKATTPSTPAP